VQGIWQTSYETVDSAATRFAIHLGNNSWTDIWNKLLVSDCGLRISTTADTQNGEWAKRAKKKYISFHLIPNPFGWTRTCSWAQTDSFYVLEILWFYGELIRWVEERRSTRFFQPFLSATSQSPKSSHAASSRTRVLSCFSSRVVVSCLSCIINSSLTVVVNVVVVVVGSIVFFFFFFFFFCYITCGLPSFLLVPPADPRGNFTAPFVSAGRETIGLTYTQLVYCI
jgi:hypothetical protein